MRNLIFAAAMVLALSVGGSTAMADHWNPYHGPSHHHHNYYAPRVPTCRAPVPAYSYRNYSYRYAPSYGAYPGYYGSAYRGGGFSVYSPGFSLRLGF